MEAKVPKRQQKLLVGVAAQESGESQDFGEVRDFITVLHVVDVSEAFKLATVQLLGLRHMFGQLH